MFFFFVFFFQAEDGIRDLYVTGVQTCALPISGEAVAAALRAEGVDASLRHPNDVVVAGRKLVGVLPEASPGRVVLGIGVNVNQTEDELPRDTVKPPTSLRLELGREMERAPLLAAILLELERGYDAW